jgi:hypothetical protein
MARTVKGLTSYKYNSVNPFLAQVMSEFKAKNKMKRVGITTQDVLNADTGELESQKLVVLGKKEYVDADEFAKIFIKNIGFFYELSKSDLKIFQLLLNKVEYNQDIVCVNMQKMAHDLNLAIQTVYNSMAKLIEREIIARADSNECFYVNPKVFFKGDRLVLINEYQKKIENNNIIKPLK